MLQEPQFGVSPGPFAQRLLEETPELLLAAAARTRVSADPRGRRMERSEAPRAPPCMAVSCSRRLH